MQASHDVCMLDAVEGCGGDRSTIKSIKDNESTKQGGGMFGGVGTCNSDREWQLHCWKGGCTNGEGLNMKYDKCANADAHDVQVSRNGCDKYRLSDGTPRSGEYPELSEQ